MVRQIRRVFAAPFIITLAGSSLAACGPKPLPKHDHVNPPGPHTNPPAPDSQPPVTEQKPPPVEPTLPGPPPIGTINPPPPDTAPQAVKEPAKFEQHWTVMKFKGKDDCSAMVDVQCPKPEKGKPVATCNPPPPIKYACPDNFKEGDTLKIVLRVGATDCFVDHGPMTCPPNAKCNPPPPRKVSCPER
jgi:predicted small lipoprotein YifL